MKLKSIWNGQIQFQNASVKTILEFFSSLKFALYVKFLDGLFWLEPIFYLDISDQKRLDNSAWLLVQKKWYFPNLIFSRVARNSASWHLSQVGVCWKSSPGFKVNSDSLGS